MTDENTEFTGRPDRLFGTAPPALTAGRRSTPGGIKLFYAEQRELLLASLHILRIIAGLAWHKEIARRRIPAWVRVYFDSWFSRKIRRIAPDSGFCFRAPGPSRIISDEDGVSILILLENDTPLSAPHTPHNEIRRLGQGRYSHWGRYMYFSSSDNTDPRKNGRVYKLVQRM